MKAILAKIQALEMRLANVIGHTRTGLPVHKTNPETYSHSFTPDDHADAAKHHFEQWQHHVKNKLPGAKIHSKAFLYHKEKAGPALQFKPSPAHTWDR